MKELLASVLFLAATALGWAQVPQNDFFTNRIQLIGPVVAIEARTAGASWGEAGCNEPCPEGGCDRSVWWSWTAPESGPVIIERLPFLMKMRKSYPNFAFASLSVFSTTNLCELQSQRVCEIDLHRHGQYAAFQAQAGVVYSIQFVGTNLTDFPNYDFRLTMTNAPVLRLQPASRRVSPSGSAFFSAFAVGLSPLHYQWQKDGSGIPDATNRMISFDDITPLHEGDYRVVVSNTTGMITSQVARLTVTPAAPLKLIAHRGTVGGEIQISVTGPLRRRYHVLASDNVNAQSAHWYSGGWISHTNETTQFSLPGDVPSRFVKLAYQPGDEVCLNNLEQIRTAMWWYAEDHRLAVFALVTTNELAEPGYLINGTWPQCPNAVGDQTNILSYTFYHAFDVPLCNFVPAVHYLDD